MSVTTAILESLMSTSVLSLWFVLCPLGGVLFAADDDRAVGMMDDVVTNTAHDGTPHLAQAAGTHDNHGRLLLTSHLTDHLPGLRAYPRLDHTRDL